MPRAQMTPTGWPGPPLVLHVVDRLAEGRKAAGLIDIIERTPPGTVRHSVLCLHGADAALQGRLAATTAVYDLGCPGWQRLGRLGALLRRLRPDILHSHDASGLGLVPLAALAGVPVRVHGEHGGDGIAKRSGGRWERLRWRMVDPLVHVHIAASHDIRIWMTTAVGIRPAKVRLIHDGIDGRLFHPVPRSDTRGRRDILPAGFAPTPDHIVIGLLDDGAAGAAGGQADRAALSEAFLALLDMVPHGRDRLRLVMDGGAALNGPARDRLKAAGAEDLAWTPDHGVDRLRLLQAMDVFALPASTEGLPEVILRAMACGLPVVAGDAGGAQDLVASGQTGALVLPGDPLALARGLAPYALRPNMRQAHGVAGRARIDNTFGLETTVGLTLDLYAEAITGRRTAGRRTAQPPAIPQE